MKENLLIHSVRFSRKLLPFMALFFASALIAAGQQVSGIVTDENDLTLPGVTIVEKGTSNGTVTDIDGRYAINVGNDAVLVFSFIGYQTTEVVIGNQSEIDLSLEPDVGQLEEVIVTGYRTQARGMVTGSVASVSAAEFEDIPTDNLSNALAGRLAGTTITQNAGTPGRESNVRIRSQGTFNNTAPLYVIDGMINDNFAFDGLHPSEVESITILKDGASAAIYGSRAANGVVLVTTKRGKEGKPKFNYNGTVGVQTPTRLPRSLNAYQHALGINNAFDYIGTPPNNVNYYTEDELEYFRNNSWDWVDELWVNPVTTQHALNVSGGTDRVSYFLGGAYTYSSGSFENLDFQKLNLRANVDVKITDDLTVSMDMNTDTRLTKGPSWGGNDWGHEDLYKALVLRPNMVPPYIDGLPVGNWVEWHPGAVIDGMGGYDRRDWRAYETRFSMKYDVPFIEGLTAKVTYNLYRRDEQRKQFNLPYNMTLFNTLGEHNHIVGTEPVGIRPRAAQEFLLRRNDQRQRYQLNGQLNYQRSFGDHTIDALFVYEQAETDHEWFHGRRDNFISPTMDQFVGGSAAPEHSQVNGSQLQTARISYVGLMGYNYQDRYMLEGSFRYDGSVVFAPENRWGFFPSISGGWRLSNESFFDSNFFDNMMLRASYGILGNDQVGTFQWLQSYTINNGAIFNTASQGLAPGRLVNRDITWEKSRSYNVGLNTTFWNNSLNLVVDVFHRNTFDILGSRQTSIPSTFGAVMPDENYQEIDSKGFEVELGYNRSFGTGANQFSYRIRGNFGYATNKIIKIDEPENLRPHQSQIGRPVGGHFGYVATGIIRTQEDLDALPAGYNILGVDPMLGMLNYQDNRGPVSDEPDGRITADDQEWLARYSVPPMNFGLSLGASYRSFSIDALFQGVAGHHVMMHVNGRDFQRRAEESSYAYWADSWTPDNPDGAYPGYRGTHYRTRFDPSSFWLRDGSFLRLKNLNISYGLPKPLLNTVGVDNIRVFFTGTNLFLLHDNIGDWGFDPEVNNIRSYPNMKTYSLGLNITM
ncbi:SusC/RagA family TonB-linked outer membrane protein [Negadavirga shengliensis]|uniref:SusC/RagA family TonB-linked outer membrane protein n=1 Tax=Negadavirga shengliensis TaxID=1389218 RepID=A0ABV9T4Q1_9BACT